MRTLATHVYDAGAAQAVGFAAAHLRGGSWNNNSDNARAAHRNNNHPANRNNNVGFRVVVVRPTPPSLFTGRLLITADAEPSPFHQGTAVSSNAGPVRFAGRGEEIEKAQRNPVRTGERHRRAHTRKGERVASVTRLA